MTGYSSTDGNISREKEESRRRRGIPEGNTPKE
jgi:hypothetical protein